MNRMRMILILFAVIVGLTAPYSARAEGWPSWLGGESSTSKTSTSKSKKSKKPTHASAKSTDKSWLSKNLFTPTKSKKKTSKYSANSSIAKRAKSKEEESGWLGSLFKPQEPEPPRSVSEWMNLKQIKP